jgi:transposase InsO family protein
LVSVTQQVPQYTSWSFTENVRRLGLISSMGTVDDCFDNALIESFSGSMQIELLNRQRWRTNLQLAVGIADYIENFYNVARRHRALNYLTPIQSCAPSGSTPPATVTWGSS